MSTMQGMKESTKPRYQKAREFWTKAAKIASKSDIFFNASAITFNLFICSIPFILILISVIGFVLSYDAAYDEIIRYGEELLPQFSYESNPDDVISGTDTIKSILEPLIGARTVFGIVGFGILIFFTQGLFHSLKHVMFLVFNFEDRAHPLMEVIQNFLVVGILGTVFLFFSLSISFLSLFNFNDFTIPLTDIVIKLSWIYELLHLTIPVLFTFLLQFVIFRFISERKIRWKVALMGALAYTVMFEITKYGLAYYLGYAFDAYRFFYQGYAVLIILGVWTFYSAILFVIAVIMAKAFDETYMTPENTIEGNPYTAIS